MAPSIRIACGPSCLLTSTSSTVDSAYLLRPLQRGLIKSPLILVYMTVTMTMAALALHCGRTERTEVCAPTCRLLLLSCHSDMSCSKSDCVHVRRWKQMAY